MRHKSASFRQITAFGLASCLFISCRQAPAVPVQASATTGDDRLPSAQLALSETVDFELPDLHGQNHRLSDHQSSEVIVLAFLGTECPLAKLYGPRLQRLATEFADRDVAFLGIAPNQQDSLAEIAAYVSRCEIRFPMLKDLGNRVADQFAATRTPEVVVLDASRSVCYRGRIDDQYGVGYSREAPEREDLKLAIEAILSGRKVDLPQTEAVGCLIGRVRTPDLRSDVSYSRQIAPILQKHCVECHREGEIGPMSLTDYDEVAGWSEMIREVVAEQRMPPWHADPEIGHFANERLMTPAEKQLLYRWVEAGAPEGDRSELPEPRRFVAGWRLPRDPDVVIPMRHEPFKVPANGVVEYQYFAVDPRFAEDRWITAADIVPGARDVVHHVIVFVAPPEDRRARGLGWLTAYVPGQGAMQLPEGQARLIPAGSKLIFQMHYTPNGKPTLDKTRLALLFTDEPAVEEEVITLFSVNGKFEIPPGASNYRVDSALDRWPAGAKLLSLAPHMHFRGKSFRFIAHWPNGEKQTLLDIPNYDFNWQNAYRLAQPIDIPEGFRIECVAHFDNSKRNLANPDPLATVRWGDQTWEEMMISFFEVAVPKHAPIEDGTFDSEERTARESVAAAKATELFERFDANEDQRLERSEVPSAFRVFAFQKYDLNGDRQITLTEAKAARF